MNTYLTKNDCFFEYNQINDSLTVKIGEYPHWTEIIIQGLTAEDFKNLSIMFRRINTNLTKKVPLITG